LQRNGFTAILKVEEQHNPVIIDICRVEKQVNDVLAVFLAFNAAIHKTANPKHYIFMGDIFALHLLPGDTDFQIRLLLFKFLQPLFCGGGHNAFLNGANEILDFPLSITKLPFKGWNHRIFLILMRHK